MALPYAVSTLHSAISDRAPQDFQDALKNESFLFDRIPIMAPSDAKGPRFRLKSSGNSNTGSFTIGGVLPAPGAFGDTEVAMSWGNYQGSFAISDRQLKQIDVAGTDMLIERVFGEQIDDTRDSMVNDIEGDTKSGSTESDTAGTIIGLDSQIADTGSVGGVNKATTTAFASYVKDNSGGGNVSLTAALMDDVWNNHLYVNKGMRPTVIFCKYDLRDFIGNLSTGAITTQTQISQNDGRQSKFIGFTDVYYRNVPVVAVPGYTANRVDFINEAALHFEALPGSNGTIFDLKEPEKDGDTYTWNMFAYLQLVLRNPLKNAASLQEVQAS